MFVSLWNLRGSGKVGKTYMIYSLLRGVCPVIAGFTETKHTGEDMMKIIVETWWKGIGNSVDLVQSEALSNKSGTVFSWNPDYFKKTGDTHFNIVICDFCVIFIILL
jgi:hypothetical protein